MPPKRKLVRCHSGQECSSKHACTSPHVVIQPFMREESTRKKYCFSSLPASAALFNKSEMSDIRIRVQPTGNVYNAHRVILGAASDVFAAMLGGQWAESNLDELELHEEADCANVFERFLYFVYTGNVAICDDYVVPLFLLAGKYNIRSLGDECAKLIERALHVFVLYDADHVSSGGGRAGSLQSSVRYTDLTDESSSSSDSSTSDITDMSDISDNDDSDLSRHQPNLELYEIPPSRTIDTSSRPMAVPAHSNVLKTYKTHMIASETFSVSVVLRLLDRCHGHERVRRAALFNLEARVGNQIIQHNYSTVWLELGTDVITAMLSDSRFGFPESKLFDAAEAWLMAHPERWQSPEVCTAVLRCIRYPLLHVNDLYEVQRNTLVQSNDEASALVLEAMRYHLFYDCSTVEDKVRWNGLQFKERVVPKH